MVNNKHFAEVIEGSLHQWIAQTWHWDTFPPFGSLISIKSEKRTLLGIVHQVHTGSLDSQRYPFAYQKTEEELKREQPQIFEFLKTTFTCLAIGYQEQGKNYYLVPPEPPKIHSFVGSITDEEIKLFFTHPHYLHLLFSFASQLTNLDELLLAIVRQLHHQQMLTEEKLCAFTQTFSLLTGNDYRRLKILMQRIEHIILS